MEISPNLLGYSLLFTFADIDSGTWVAVFGAACILCPVSHPVYVGCHPIQKITSILPRLFHFFTFAFKVPTLSQTVMSKTKCSNCTNVSPGLLSLGKTVTSSAVSTGVLGGSSQTLLYPVCPLSSQSLRTCCLLNVS